MLLCLNSPIFWQRLGFPFFWPLLAEVPAKFGRKQPFSLAYILGKLCGCNVAPFWYTVDYTVADTAETANACMRTCISKSPLAPYSMPGNEAEVDIFLIKPKPFSFLRSLYLWVYDDTFYSVLVVCKWFCTYLQFLLILSRCDGHSPNGSI